MTSQDPYRAALASVLGRTIKKARFPRLSAVTAGERHGPASIALLRQGRYLARLRWGREKSDRCAVTMRGLAVTGSSAAHDELEALVDLHGWLVPLLPSIALYSGAEHDMVRLWMLAPHLAFTDFQRLLTQLCVPRLLPDFDKDALGSYGQGFASGTPDPTTGFLRSVSIRPRFEYLEIPVPSQDRKPLVPERTWRAKALGGVYSIERGGEAVCTIMESLGARVLATLINDPGVRHHAMDLQAAPFTESPAKTPTRRELRRQAKGVGLAPRLGPASPDDIERFAVVLRRYDLYARLATERKQSVGRCVHMPHWRAEDLLAALRSHVEKKGFVSSSFPPVKHAKRSIRRSLNDVLARPALRELREFVVGHEWLKFVPP